MATTRYHSYHNEKRAMRQLEQDIGGDEEEESREEAIAESEDRQSFDAYYAEARANDAEWIEARKARPNWHDLSLHARAAQKSGLVANDLDCFAITDDHNPHAAFVEASVNKNWVKEKTDDEKLAYRTAEDTLMKDTLTKVWGVCATLSNAADSTLRNARKSRIIFVDEVCQSTELETLLAWVHRCDTAQLVIMVGDPIQLPCLSTHNSACPSLSVFGVEVSQSTESMNNTV
ncbi:MAG: hypothetical protein Q9166_003342 [cf. Caloplaca sp. 2 TL-2023]